MSNLLLTLSLIAGAACLGWELRAKAGGFEEIAHLFVFLLVYLPLCGIPSIAIIVATGVKSHWPVVFSAGLIVLASSLQFALLVGSGYTRWSYCFAPILVILCSGIRLAHGSALVELRSWISHAGPVLALIGVGAIAAAFGVRANEGRRLEDRVQALRAEDARKNQALRDLDRAAWLLSKEFSAEAGFRESGFLRAGAFHTPAADYRWDDSRQRLIATLPVLGDGSAFRSRVLPVASRALASQALRPGVHADLGDAVLRCASPLECSLTWEIAVNSLQPDARELYGKLSDRVISLEVSLIRELSLQP